MFNEAAEVLRIGRSRGATSLWLGGGEPTIHPLLDRVLIDARSLGYGTIKIQTNAMRFAHAAFARHMVTRGVTQVSVSLFGVDALTHDRFAQRPGAFDLTWKAIDNLSNSGIIVEADILVTTDSMQHLPEMLRTFASRGIRRYWFWLMSVHGLTTAKLDHLVPKLGEAGRHIAIACDAADALGVEAWSLHTPPCVLPIPHRDRYRHSGHLRLLVATPGGQRFMSEESPMEGGVFLAGCGGCQARCQCLGLRRDYLDVHGAAGITPIETAASP